MFLGLLLSSLSTFLCTNVYFMDDYVFVHKRLKPLYVYSDAVATSDGAYWCGPAATAESLKTHFWEALERMAAGRLDWRDKFQPTAWSDKRSSRRRPRECRRRRYCLALCCCCCCNWLLRRWVGHPLRSARSFFAANRSETDAVSCNRRINTKGMAAAVLL